MASGQRIKNRMEEKGISANKLAEIVGVSRSTIFLDIKGAVEEIPAGRLAAIARALDTTVSYLMDAENSTRSDTESANLAVALFDSLPPSEQEEALRYLDYLKSRAEAKEK